MILLLIIRVFVIRWLIGELFNRLIGELVNRLIGELVNRLIEQKFNW
jgi:hypothetical protein